jgi:hypothetical protein
MWFFLIPVIILAGATFAGGALEMSSKPTNVAPLNPTNQPTPVRPLPVNGPLPSDPPTRIR